MPLLLLTLAAAGCTKPVQRRFQVIEAVEFTPSSSLYYYHDNTKNLNLVEEECMKIPALDGIDHLLSKGAKVIAITELKIPVIKNRADFFNRKIAGNCIGKEFILEGDEKIFDVTAPGDLQIRGQGDPLR